MNVLETRLPEVKIVEPAVFVDARGFLLEAWNARSYAEAGIASSPVQENHSRSGRGVLRGLHYQVGRPQGKLIRVVAGRIWDVAVDLRRSSPRFGQWVGLELSAADHRLLWIPEGFAHGFLALEEGSELIYKCTDFYAPEHERALLWSDETLRIDWPLKEVGEPSLSERDRSAPRLADAETYE